MKKIYFVDTENEGGVNFLRILDEQKGNFEMHIFFTNNSRRITMNDLAKILSQKEKIFAHACYCGKNAVDFQMVSELGYLIASDRASEYILLSNDAGFDPCVRYWADQGIKIMRCSCQKRGNEDASELITENQILKIKSSATESKKERKEKSRKQMNEHLDAFERKYGVTIPNRDKLVQVLKKGQVQKQVQQLEKTAGKKTKQFFYKKLSAKKRQELRKIIEEEN